MLGIALQFITGGFSRALSWATANATRMMAIALVAALAWGWLGWHGKAEWKDAAQVQKAAIIAAQAEAAAWQAARDARQVATNDAVNKGSTDDNAKGLSAARDAVAAYARLHQAPRYAPGQAKPTAMHSDPGVDALGSEGPAMASIAVADLDTLAAGTVRAESCRAWGAAMIDAGLAEAGD